MPLPITLQKLRMYREWIEYSKGQEFEDYDTRWDEFLDEWRTEKALNMLSESFEAEFYGNMMSCPVCGGDSIVEGDWADCNHCAIKWNVINEGSFYYLEAEDGELQCQNCGIGSDEWPHGMKEITLRNKWGDDGDYAFCGDGCEGQWMRENAMTYLRGYEMDAEFSAEDAEDYGVEDVWMSEENWFTISYGEIIQIIQELEEASEIDMRNLGQSHDSMGRHGPAVSAVYEKHGTQKVATAKIEYIGMMRNMASFNAESFSDWADDELRTHGKNVTFNKWVQEEYEDEPAHRHPDGQLSFIQWSNDEMREKHHAEHISDGTPFWSVIKLQDDGSMDSDWGVEDHDTLKDAKEAYDYHVENCGREFAIMINDNLGEGNWTTSDSKKDAEVFCAECGYDSKKAKSFSAETAEGNQVFNSCWKCGSGQHLYQISRYPASPDEIAGIGMDPSQATPNWDERRNPPTA